MDLYWGLIRVCYRLKLNNGNRQSKLSSPVVHLDCNWVRIRRDEADSQSLNKQQMTREEMLREKGGDDTEAGEATVSLESLVLKEKRLYSQCSFLYSFIWYTFKFMSVMRHSKWLKQKWQGGNLADLLFNNHKQIYARSSKLFSDGTKREKSSFAFCDTRL